MANNTTKKAGSNKSFIDRMGGQKFIVLLVVIALFIFFCAMSPNFRKYTTFINILDFSYYIVLMAIGVAFPLMTGGVDLVPRAEGFDPVNVFRIGLHCKHIKLTGPISKAEILFGKGELFPEGAAGIGGAFTKNPRLSIILFPSFERLRRWR